MAFGPRRCACCGSFSRVKAYRLYTSRSGDTDDLTIWLCAVCHHQTHELKGRVKAVLAPQNAPDARSLDQTNLPRAWDNARATNRKLATDFAAHVLPVIGQLKLNGVTNYRAIAAALNAMGMKTARGGEWHSTTVGNMLRRAPLLTSLIAVEVAAGDTTVASKPTGTP